MKIRPTRFPLGSSYYPPAHDPEDWERDLMAMRAAGLNMIRTAELITSWDYIEPRRGQPEWDWLDRTFELAEKHDFDIVLGTGSCNPPIWMLEPYPDLQRISREGVPYPTNTVAGWACVNNPGLRRELRRYLTLLLERYDDMPALYCWQLDNQIGHNSAFSGAEHAQPRRYGYCCYCDHCAEAFRTWLEAKYGDIDALNHAWTWDPTHYRYYGWHQLQPPRSMLAEWGNGTAWLDFRRFVHDSLNRDAQFSMRTALLPLAGFVGSLIGGWLPGLLADARGLSPAVVGPYRDALLLAALLYLPVLLAMLRAGEAERKTPDRDTPDRDQEPRNLSRAIPYGIILPLVVVDMMRLSAEVGLLGFSTSISIPVSAPGPPGSASSSAWRC